MNEHAHDGSHRIKLNMAERGMVEEIARALPGADGRPFMTADIVFRLSLDIARRVIAAGRLGEFQPDSSSSAYQR